MTRIAKGFLSAGIVYGLLGMALGLHMAIGNDHGQRVTHAHMLVIGWVSFFLFGLFYLHFGTAVNRLLAAIHFWVAQVSMFGMMVGLWLIYSGRPQFEPIPAASASAYAASFVVFALLALPPIWKRD